LILKKSKFYEENSFFNNSTPKHYGTHSSCFFYYKSFYLEIKAIVVEEETRMGAIMIWCPIVKKGIWLSRVKVPLAFKEEEPFDISDINWVSP